MKACVPKRVERSLRDLGQLLQLDRRDHPALRRGAAGERHRHMGVQAVLVGHERAPHQSVDLSALLQCGQHLRRVLGFGRQLLDLSLRGARDTPADHVRRADQHGGRLAGGRERARQSGRHRIIVVDLELALRVELGDAVHGAFRLLHLRAQRILHRVDKQGRLRAEQVERVADIGADGQRQHAADRQKDQRTEAERHDDRDRNAPPFLGGRTKRTGSVRRIHVVNVVRSRRIASPGRMNQVASAARAARPARQRRRKEDVTRNVLSRSTASARANRPHRRNERCSLPGARASPYAISPIQNRPVASH